MNANERAEQALSAHRLEVENEYRASAYPREDGETEEHYRERVEARVKMKRPEIEREALSRATETMNEYAAGLKRQIAETEARAEAGRIEEERRAAAEAASQQAAALAKQKADAVLADAARRGVPVARANESCEIYEGVGYEFVDYRYATPKLIPSR